MPVTQSQIKSILWEFQSEHYCVNYGSLLGISSAYRRYHLVDIGYAREIIDIPIMNQSLGSALILYHLTTFITSKNTDAFQLSAQQPRRRWNSNQIKSSVLLSAAPEGALSDIVIPSIFDFDVTNNTEDVDPRVWVPQTACLSFRPLCFCTSQGYYVNLLKFTGGGVLGRHRHSSPVHALTLKGSWGYREHSWGAHPGTYVFEPPGETHTLIVDKDCDEMVALFHVTGSLLYVSEDNDEEVIGFDDVFTKLEKARSWYEECGLGKDYADQFIR